MQMLGFSSRSRSAWSGKPSASPSTAKSPANNAASTCYRRRTPKSQTRMRRVASSSVTALVIYALRLRGCNCKAHPIIHRTVRMGMRSHRAGNPRSKFANLHSFAAPWCHGYMAPTGIDILHSPPVPKAVSVIFRAPVDVSMRPAARNECTIKNRKIPYWDRCGGPNPRNILILPRGLQHNQHAADVDGPSQGVNCLGLHDSRPLYKLYATLLTEGKALNDQEAEEVNNIDQELEEDLVVAVKQTRKHCKPAAAPRLKRCKAKKVVTQAESKGVAPRKPPKCKVVSDAGSESEDAPENMDEAPPKKRLRHAKIIEESNDAEESEAQLKVAAAVSTKSKAKGKGRAGGGEGQGHWCRMWPRNLERMQRMLRRG
ncbi:hypothetical protein C8F04DRAFT_1190642 [Mycena alexandri]|uniref:Uncharacterized protein n=1 Tax=Mycena alexandri TaxID=1745969 RepID=A0AAD6SEU1_9AGAR|nr:hypothetical protein C8F04DRAFT_1190642 [Mycena alexandri]